VLGKIVKIVPAKGDNYRW